MHEFRDKELGQCSDGRATLVKQGSQWREKKKARREGGSY